MMNKLVSDDIPNIRFNVAKTYAILIDVLQRLPSEGSLLLLEKAGERSVAPAPRGREVIQEQILPNLKKLQDDEDVDVRYFATAAFNTLGGSGVSGMSGMMGKTMLSSP
jgi:serine/threonine-protein phosphatase 2A regulatory subunit A